MQIYGILLNIRGIFTENAWKITENMRKIVEFPRNSFLNIYLDDPFSRSFRGRFSGHSWRKSEKIREFRRISAKIREYRRKSFLFIPFHYTFFPQYPDFMLYNIFIIDTLSERLNV